MDENLNVENAVINSIAARMQEEVKVSLSAKQLKADKLELGLTNPEMAAKYSISVAQLKRALVQAGLDDIRPRKTSFILVNDLTEDDIREIESLRKEEKEIVEHSKTE